MRKPEKAIIKRASDICNSCINPVNVMLKGALGRNVAMIAGAILPGKCPRPSVMKLLNTPDFAMRSGRWTPYGH